MWRKFGQSAYSILIFFRYFVGDTSTRTNFLQYLDLGIQTSHFFVEKLTPKSGLRREPWTQPYTIQRRTVAVVFPKPSF